MAYRVAPSLGAYRSQPLLGWSLAIPFMPKLTQALRTAAPLPSRPVISTPTRVLVPMTAPAPAPIPMSIQPSPLATAAQVPTMPGASPAMPAYGGGGGGGGGADTSAAPAPNDTAAPASGLPGWVLPAAAIGAALLFFA